MRTSLLASARALCRSRVVAEMHQRRERGSRSILKLGAQHHQPARALHCARASTRSLVVQSLLDSSFNPVFDLEVPIFDDFGNRRKKVVNDGEIDDSPILEVLVALYAFRVAKLPELLRKT